MSEKEKEWTEAEVVTALEAYESARSHGDCSARAARLLANRLGLKLKPELPKRIDCSKGIVMDADKAVFTVADSATRSEVARRYRAVEEALEYANSRVGDRSYENYINIGKWSEIIRILREGGAS